MRTNPDAIQRSGGPPQNQTQTGRPQVPIPGINIDVPIGHQAQQEPSNVGIGQQQPSNMGIRPSTNQPQVRTSISGGGGGGGGVSSQQPQQPEMPPFSRGAMGGGGGGGSASSMVSSSMAINPQGLADSSE